MTDAPDKHEASKDGLFEAVYMLLSARCLSTVLYLIFVGDFVRLKPEEFAGLRMALRLDGDRDAQKRHYAQD